MTFKPCATCGLIVVMVSLSVPLYASSPTCSPDAAQIAYTRGLAAYEAREYEKASRLFEEGYEICPYPVLVQASSICEGQLGHYARAITLAERSLLLAQSHGDHIGGLSTQERLATRAYIVAWGRVLQASSLASAPRVEPPPQKTTSRAPAIGVLVVGGLTLSSSAVFTLILQSTLDELEAQASQGTPASFEDTAKRAQRLQVAGRVTLFSGLALTALGTSLFILSSRDATPRAGLKLHLGARHLALSLEF